MAESGITPLLLAAEVMVASLVLCAALLTLLHRSRRQVRRLRRQRSEAAGSAVERFLQRELQASRRLRTSADRPQRRLSALRSRWLQAELHALVQKGMRPSDLHQLEQDAAPLLAELSGIGPLQPEPAPAATATATGADHALERARSTIVVQRQTISGLRELLELYRKRMGGVDAAATGEADRALNRVEEGTEQLQSIIGGLQRELNRAQEHYRLASLEIERLRAAAPATAPAQAQQLLAEMAAAFNDGSRELSRLQEANQRQRAMILQLEQQLLALRQDAGEKPVGQELLGKLRLQLRDYEMCTTMLEQETERLRGQIAALSAAMAAPASPAPATAAAAPAAAEPQQRLIALLALLAQATELEPAAAHILNFFRELRMQAVLFVKGPRRQLWLATEGAVDRRDKQLLQGTQVDPKRPWLEAGDDSLLLYPCCHLLLRAPATERAALHGPLVAAGPALNAALERLDGVSLAGSQLQELSQRLAGLEVQSRYLTEESRKAVAGFYTELETLLASTALTDLQRQCVGDTLRDLKTRLDVLDKAAAVTHRTLLAAIEQLDGGHRSA